MALVLGGAFIGALIVYDNLASHDDYGDYSDYSNYGDAEERRQRRITSLKSDIENAAEELAGYKRTTVNPELSSQKLKEQTAMRVSRSSMDSDVKGSIKQRIADESSVETQELKKELSQIDELLKKIDEIQRGR